MKYGICSLSIIPQRAAPQDEAEMVNQLLFGDIFTVLESKNQWRKVLLVSDGYTGWIDEKQMTALNLAEFEELKNANQKVLDSNFSDATILNSRKNIQVYRGSTFYFNAKNNPLFAKVNGEFSSSQPSATAIIKYAQSFLTVPYLWGGRSILGIDCSGFTQVVYKLCGIALLRDTPQQETQGDLILFENKKPGDLAFFNNKYEKIIHVGILLNNNKIIHASGEIIIDDFTKTGIFRTDRNLHTHNLHSIKRLF